MMGYRRVLLCIDRCTGLFSGLEVSSRSVYKDLLTIVMRRC